ncbi:MAG: DNA polymerase Y family protein [Cytophagales bacterium]|nr:DNA polymerase Y family protein [Rhizobacter sp.]
MLWVALHLPLLSLESFAATVPPEQAAQPLALMDVHHIVSANSSAQALGVQPGMKRATALSLAPHLVLGQADERRDLDALISVAHAALAFAPAVSLSLPCGVLLEVQASLRYFGGLVPLLKKLRATLAPLGHQLHCVSAPTAQGAALLSCLHDGLHCADRASLQRALEAAPVALLGAGYEHAEALLGMGLRTLGDLRQLPRAGLARRFGVALLDEMDRAFGDCPDPREPITLPPVFHSQLELFARADTTEQLLYGAQVLLARLVAWLSGQHAFVRSFSLVMKHEARWRPDQTAPATVLEIALAEPSRDAAHMLTLLRERLGALQLPAPTLELALQSADISRRPPPNAELFPTPQSEHAGLTRLIERLQARLGREQVQRLVPVADHRPERATAVVAAEPLMPRLRDEGHSKTTLGHTITRPVWLLPQPQALQERRSRPLLEGKVLQLLAGPERIEAGWWDGALAERDYFIGQTAEGALVWLYRARLPLPAEAGGGEGWFLHGRFA